MLAFKDSVKTGQWTDHTTHQTYLVESTTHAYVLVAFVGVWLSFTAKHIKQIITRLALYAHLKLNKKLLDDISSGESQVAVPQNFPSRPTESTPLINPTNATAQTSQEKTKRSARKFAEILKVGGGVRDFFAHCVDAVFDSDLTRWHIFLIGIFTLCLSVTTVVFIAGGIFFTRIKTNGPAPLGSKKCGLWVFDRERGGAEAATRAGIRDLEKEIRAGEYAQHCYGSAEKFDAIQCNFLYRSKLLFSPPQYTTDCPFQNEICGQNQTVTFTTDTVEASDLGINSPSSPKFRRRTSCTPLSMEYPYIRNGTHNGTTTYYYYYGEKPLHSPPLDYTYTTTGDPFNGLAPAYDVFAYISGSTPAAHGYWKPRAELTHPDFSTITLLFISSLHILYKKRSDDPIFPADQEIFLPQEQKPWFRNSDPRARPLACIDYIEVCLGDGKTCWPMNNPVIPRDTDNKTISPPPEFWLMYASLWRTNVYNMIEKRLGRALIAQSKVSKFYSDALEDYHWVDEVERLVATSLARTQINAWSIASGEDSVHEGKDGYSLVTPESEVGNLCGKFKYNPPGYASIHYAWLWVSICSFPFFLVLSRKWEEVKWTTYWPFMSWEETDIGQANTVFHHPQGAAATAVATQENVSSSPNLSSSPEQSSQTQTPQHLAKTAIDSSRNDIARAQANDADKGTTVVRPPSTNAPVSAQ